MRSPPDTRVLVRCADCHKLIHLRAGDERASWAPGDIYCFECCGIPPSEAIEDRAYDRWCDEVENEIRMQADLKAGIDYGPLNVDWP